MKLISAIVPTLCISMLGLVADCRHSTPPPPTNECTEWPCRIIDGAGNPDWSPTGERFAFLRIADSMLCLYYFSDKRIEPLVHGEEPSFSPEGKKLAFEWRRRIFIYDTQAKTTQDIAAGVAPAWSENGRWIAFAHPTSFKRTSTGDMIPGDPNPDSSLYVYDVSSQTISRVVINNLNPPSGPQVGITYPTWVLKDSFLMFATEPELLAVSRQGGGFLYRNWIPAPNAAGDTKLRTLAGSHKTSYLGAGRSSWNRSISELLFESGEAVFPSGLESGLYRLVFGSTWGTFYTAPNAADPSWAQDSGRRMLYDINGSLYINQPH